jgi:hypothetical protein
VAELESAVRGDRLVEAFCCGDVRDADPEVVDPAVGLVVRTASALLPSGSRRKAP